MWLEFNYRKIVAYFRMQVGSVILNSLKLLFFFNMCIWYCKKKAFVGWLITSNQFAVNESPCELIFLLLALHKT